MAPPIEYSLSVLVGAELGLVNVAVALEAGEGVAGSECFLVPRPTPNPTPSPTPSAKNKINIT